MILFSTDLQYQSFRLHIPCQSSWQRQRHQHLQLTSKEIPIFEITVQSIWTFPEVSVPKTTTVRPLWRVVLHLQRQPHVSRTLFIHGCWLRDRLWQQLLFILLFQVSYSLFSNNNETIISLSRLLFNVRYLFLSRNFVGTTLCCCQTRHDDHYYSRFSSFHALFPLKWDDDLYASDEEYSLVSDKAWS